MPLVMYPMVFCGIPTEFESRQQLASSLTRRNKINASPQQLLDYIKWRRAAEFHCGCEKTLLTSPPPEELKHCPVPQSPERFSDDVSLPILELYVNCPSDLEERMRLRACYQPWVTVGYAASSLHWAAVKGDCRFVQSVAKALPNSVFFKDTRGNTALMLAVSSTLPVACVCKETRENCVVHAMLAPCDPEQRRRLVGQKNDEGLTALHFAALNGRLDFLRLLLQHGVHPDSGLAIMKEEEDERDSAVAEDEKTEDREEEAKKRAEDQEHGVIETQGKTYGLTPLHLAVLSRGQGATACVRLLLQAGADAQALLLRQALGQQWNLKIECGCGGCWSRGLMTVVTPSNADPDIRSSYGSALHVAVTMNDAEKVSAMLEEQGQFGVDVNYSDWAGWNSLAAAATRLNSSIMDALIRHQADVNARYYLLMDDCEPGGTVLHILLSHNLRQPQRHDACLWCRTVKPMTEQRLLQMVESVLRSQQCDINARDMDGFTPLLVAAMRGHVSCCRSLLHHGADPVVRGDSGLTPLYFACKLDEEELRDELVNLLLRQGIAHQILRKYCTGPEDRSSRTSPIWVKSKLRPRGPEHWSNPTSPIRVVSENRDRRSLVKLYRAGAISTDTLRKMHGEVLSQTLCLKSGPEGEKTRAKSMEFCQAIGHLLGTLQSLSDRCLHVLSTGVGVAPLAVRKSRLERTVARTVQQLPDDGEPEDMVICGIPTEIESRQQLASSLTRRNKINASPQQLLDYIKWRRAAEFRCGCEKTLLTSPPPEELKHCPVPQSPERFSDDVSLPILELYVNCPSDLEERMRLGGCYQPWVTVGYAASSLHWAAVKGDCRFVQSVAKALPNSVFFKDTRGNTALMLAVSSTLPVACVCKETRENCVVQAMLAPCDPEQRRRLVGQKNDEGLTALHFAALNGRLDFLRLLLQHGVHPDSGLAIMKEEEDERDSAVAEDEKTEDREEEAKKRAEDQEHGVIETRGKTYGLTPLHLAVLSRGQGATACVRLLLQAGADAQAEMLVKQALGQQGNLKIECGCGGCWSRGLMTVVTPSNADPDIHSSYGSALHVAVTMNDAEKVSAMLEEQGQFGVDVNYSDWAGWNSLAAAATRLNSSIMDALIRHQADVNARYYLLMDDFEPGGTVLHILLSHNLSQPQRHDACLWCRTVQPMTEQRLLQTVESVLRSQRCVINARDMDGFTPLLVAAMRGHVSCCRSLLHHGADPVVRGDSGLTPLYFACKLDEEELRDELVNLLLRQGIAHQTMREYCTGPEDRSSRTSPIRVKSKLRPRGPKDWSSPTSPIWVVSENRDRRSLVKLYRAGAISTDTLRRMHGEVLSQTLCLKSGPEGENTRAKSMEFCQAIGHLLGTLQSLSDRCLHVLSTGVGVAPLAVRKSRLERTVARTVQQLPDDGEPEDSEAPHQPVLAIVQQRMEVLNLM
ncbi:hypothetical protein ACOMHN_020135 [Nucella lapillus]